VAGCGGLRSSSVLKAVNGASERSEASETAGESKARGTASERSEPLVNLTNIALSVLNVLHDDAATVATTDAALADTHAALRFHDELAAAISARRPVVPDGQRETREQEHLRRQIEDDLALLDAGFGEGITRGSIDDT
jgi:hypothetical protein